MSRSVDLLDPDVLVRDGYPWDTWAELRRHDPVSRLSHGEIGEYWALVRHAEIVSVSRRPREFLSSPRLTMPPRRPQDVPEEEILPETIITMDPPRHGAFRALTSRHFTARALGALEPRVQAIADDVVERAVTRYGDGDPFDFVAEISARLPLTVIMELLGVPRADWDVLLQLTNEVVGVGDPEYSHGDASNTAGVRARDSIFTYYKGYVAERRARPRDDLISVLTHADLDGRKLSDKEILGYCFLLNAAGNETTRNAASGGALALIEHPGELERLRREPRLLRTGADEIVRWTSPIMHFCRTAAVDAEIGGQKIAKGDTLVLFYPSAGRDERVFERPDVFDLSRSPNPHLSFGIGEHYCLGARLARIELECVFRALAARVESLELSGPVERLRSTVVGGIKRMPVRLRARASL
jgi:cholest-4-en-3-one 26-monooxygenase